MVLMDVGKTGKFKEEMYSTLLYPHHVISKNKKLIDFKDDRRTGEIVPSMEGYYAHRGDTLFVLQEDIKDDLPIKMVSENLPVHVAKPSDVVNVVPHNTEGTEYYRSFRIIPDRMLSYSEMLDCNDQLHSTGKQFSHLYGNLLYTAMLSRINVAVSGNVGSGKSSFAKVLNNIYDCVPVIQKPSTAPALAPGVSTEGVLFIDELSGLKDANSIKGVETVINSLAEGGDRISFGTAGSKAYGTQNPPPTTYLSCVIVYNLFGTKEDCSLDVKDSPFKPSYYKKKDFFDWMWDNQASVVDRFLRLKMPDGKLDVSQFIDNPPLTSEDKTLLKKLAKSAAYYRDVAKVGFITGVHGYPPELSSLDVEHIKSYIFNDMGISKESRYLNTLLEMLKFSMVASERDYTKFKWYADSYKKWMTDYEDMTRLSNPNSTWDKDNNISSDATPSVPKIPKKVTFEEVGMNNSLDLYDSEGKPDLDRIEELLI